MFVFADHERVFFVRIPAYSTKLKYDITCFPPIMTLLIVHGNNCLQFTCVFCIFAVNGQDGTVENAPRILEF